MAVMKKICARMFSFLFCFYVVLPHHVFAEGKIASGSWHTCIVTDAGGLKCWGNNVYNSMGCGIENETTQDEGNFTVKDVNGLP